MMISAGLVALAVLAVALLFAVVMPDRGDMSGIIGIISALGDSALFGYFFKIWKDCSRDLKEAYK